MASPAAAVQCLNTAQTGTDLPNYIAQHILSEAYKRAGLCANFKSYPTKRAQTMLINKAIDANVWRSESFIDTHKSKMIAITPPITTMQSVIIYNQEKFNAPFDKKMLRDRHVGTLLGCPFAKQVSLKTGAIPAEVHYYELMIGMLRINRLDAAIIPYDTYLSINSKNPLPKNFKVHPLKSFKLYHVLSKSYAHHAGALSTALTSVLAEQNFRDRLKEAIGE